ncbi:helix-turn-helix domain-containing protein [Bdellovibrio sp. HCB337]|uniref:helix-turn-helix domain-containing protein n=1 Tax=Bdellovibrio sp. HCB337 TaxID=3394358 RepID=UPI0039A604F8
MQKIQFNRLALIIKDIMKKQGVSYRDLAKALQVSESGIKKVMVGKDCSFNKLVRICSVLDVPVQNVLAAAVQNASLPTPLTGEQRKLLNSDDDTYRVLNCLQMNDYNLKFVSRLLGLKKEQIYPHLKKLEEVNLIVWFKGDKIKSFAPLYYDFKGVPASQRDGDRLRQNVLNKVITPDLEKSASWACRKVRANPMRRELLEEMNSKIQKLIEDYMWQNAREWELYPKKEMVRAGWVYSCFPFGQEESWK